jgi:selenocysteine lyase/cysteine desulfurase
MSATGRKFMRGPRGTGLLYVSDRALESGLEMFSMDMRGADWISPNEYRVHPTARRFEQFEFSHANVIGLAEAIQYANSLGLKNIEVFGLANSQYLRGCLSDLPGIRMLDQGSNLCNIVTFIPTRVSIDTLVKELKFNMINFSISTRANALLDFTKKGVEQAIRFSPHYYNTTEEADIVLDIVRLTCSR